MFRHLIYGQLIESAFPLSLPAAVSAANGEREIRIRDAAFSSDLQSTVKWFHEFRTSESELAWLSLGRLGEDYFLRFDSGFLIRIEPVRKALTFDTRGHDLLSPFEIEAHLLNHALPLLLSLGTAPVIHGAAVKFPKGAALFTGSSGSGKSTLVHHLSEQGLPLLTDDCARFDETAQVPSLYPGYPAIRMVEQDGQGLDCALGKFYFRTAPEISPFEAIPVAALFLLEPSDSDRIEIRQLSGNERQLTLTRNAFRLETEDPAHLGMEFQRLASLASRLPGYVLRYPHQFESLPEVYRTLSDHLERS